MKLHEVVWSLSPYIGTRINLTRSEEVSGHPLTPIDWSHEVRTVHFNLHVPLLVLGLCNFNFVFETKLCTRTEKVRAFSFHAVEIFSSESLPLQLETERCTPPPVPTSLRLAVGVKNPRRLILWDLATGEISHGYLKNIYNEKKTQASKDLYVQEHECSPLMIG